MRTIHDVLTRLRGEYLEMPGLRLTANQVQHLCGIERMLCQSILDALVDGAFLSVNPDGTYARLTDGNIVARPGVAKADVRREGPSLKAS
jgi:hypothetical protein